jgi:multidrug efflux pump subunit AcrB
VEIFFIRTEMPNGTSLAKHATSIQPIEALVAALPKEEILNFVSNIGIQQQDPHDPFTRRGSEFAQVSVYLTPENQRNRTAGQIIEDLRQKIGKPEGIVHVTFDRLNPGPPTGKAVSLGVRGREFSEILPAVKVLREKLAEIPGVTDISDSYILGKEEVRIKVDTDKAASAGITVANVGFTTRAAFEGIEATSIKTLDEENKVRVSLPRQETSDVSILNQLFIPNRMGNLVPLQEISSLEIGQGPLFIQHEANERQVTVSAGVNTEINSSLSVNALLKDILPEINKKFPNIKVVFGGEDEDTQESFESLGRTFLVAIAGVYLILVLTFGNLLQPFVVMLTVPLGLVSVLWAFILHGLPISFMGCLGAVALTGVIVNNAIVLVDFINQHKNENRTIQDSILFAAKDRLRPIFLTTVTTVIGVLPTAYGLGGLDKFVVPIAMSLGWGLMFGALLTAFVFPPVMAILEDFRSLFRKSDTSRPELK